MSNRAALEVVLATIALHLIAAPGAGTGPMMVAPAAARSANAPGRATDSSGTLAGVLLGQEDGQPVPYGTVLIIETDESQFTDADGHFRIGRIVPGKYTVRARQIGYAPTDTTVRIDSAPAVTTITYG